jgi:hypothetical protein
MSDSSAAAAAGEQLIGGRHSQTFRTAIRAGLKVDTKGVRKLDSEFQVLKKTVEALRKEMDSLETSATKAANAVGSATQPGSRAKNGQEPFRSTSLPVGTTRPLGGGPPGGGPGGPGGPPGGGPGGGMGALAATFSKFAPVIGAATAVMGLQQAVQTVDARIDRGIEYATSADRMNVLMQQMYGKSQMDVMRDYRQPLTQFRLGGPQAINAMLQYQTQTGMSAAGVAPTVEAIRAMSGYSMSAADVLRDQQALMAPQTVNRMFTNLGVSAYGIGGSVTDPMELRNEIIKRLGLTERDDLTSAFRPGSLTRERMRVSGVPMEMQDQLLQQAQMQIQYRQKGGMGDYDPGNVDHRRIMGIEENLATQQEETERLRAAREEKFMERQIDNFEQLERNTQTMVKLLGSIEDKMSGLIGTRASTRPWMNLAGRALQIGGVAAMATGIGVKPGLVAFAAGSAMTGDPPESGAASKGSAGTIKSSDSSRDSTISIPSGWGGGRATLDEIKQRPTFRKLHPNMQNRLLAMFRENPKVGLGEGYRESAGQKAMFLSRYRRTSKKTGTYYDGSYWEHVSGAAAAPPGRSMHEIGLAADLVGDLDWMNANAHRFGLQHFKSVNNEPWHVQPAELPRGRGQYEKQGAPWGTEGFDEETDFSADAGPVTGMDPDEGHSHDHGGGHGGGGRGVGMFSGMSISEIVAGVSALATSGLGSFGSRSGGGGTGPESGSSGSVPVDLSGTGPLSGEQIAQLAFNAGFRGQDLVDVVAIAKRESSWNPRAHNPNRKTKDNSYGLMQINMIDGLGPARLKEFGLSSYEDLFDPVKNMQAAFKLYQQSGNTLRPWGGYKGKENTYNTNVAEAQNIVASTGLLNRGDPMPMESGASTHVSKSSTIHNSPTINYTAQFHFHGAPADTDVRRILDAAESDLRRRVQMMDMRTS